MDALYPRLLVSRFAETFRFYDAVLPKFAGGHHVKGTEAGPYAQWDRGDEALVILHDRGIMAAALGTDGLPVRPAAASQDAAMLVCRVDDVDAALTLCLEHGGELVVGATDRSNWGPNLRTAHLRDPDGNLIELQSY
ncbi:MAG TPA: VOC family protein [Actinospica sp.]|nr:VOC family protein [Actinospica sp.]